MEAIPYLAREPGCDDDRDDGPECHSEDAGPDPFGPPVGALHADLAPVVRRAVTRPMPVAPTATVHGHVLDVPDDYGAGTGPVQVAVVNAMSVKTGEPAPGYDRPFRVTAWELRIARNGATLAHLGRDCARLARVTGCSPPRWMERAVGELLARRVTSADTSARIAEWHRANARKRAACDSPVAWRDREHVPAVPAPVPVPAKHAPAAHVPIPAPLRPRKATVKADPHPHLSAGPAWDWSGLPFVG